MKKVFFLLLGFPVLALAQHDASHISDTAACFFSGTVVDEDGNPVELATVLLMKGDSVLRGAQTDHLGRYQFTGNMEPGLLIVCKYLILSKSIPAQPMAVIRLESPLYRDGDILSCPVEYDEDQHLKTLDHIWHFNRRITD